MTRQWDAYRGEEFRQWPLDHPPSLLMRVWLRLRGWHVIGYDIGYFGLNR